MTRRTVQTDGAPQAVGPYSQAVVAGEWVYVSGQIPLDPATGEMVEGDIEAQAERALQNVRAVLEAAGSSLHDVVKATVFLTDMGEFGRVNEVYARFFGDSLPARACVEVSRLPKDARVEIEAVAVVRG